MRAHLASRLRSSSLSAVPPPQTSSDYSTSLARVAAGILYRSPIPSKTNHPVYILNAAAFPDADEVDFDKLLPYVLARLPGEEELIGGTDYEVVFLAGGNPDSVTSGKKNRPGWGWFIQAYHVLSRAMRKRLQKLYIVHERSWVRILVELFSTIVSPKFRRKIVHVSNLSALALHIPIEDLLLPPSAYLNDRRLSPDIHVPYSSGRRAFTVKEPLPKSATGLTRLPRVLRETTTFLLLEPNIRSEGLFRVPAHARLKDALREAYDRGQKYIVWKDNEVVLPIPPYPLAHHQDQVIDEVDSKDAYGALMAAGLLKQWYSELRQPIFPDFTYRDLKTNFNDPSQEITLEQLAELISPHSEWSKMPFSSRVILVRHLLPLLAIVSSRSEQNKMTAENLAVCFAPALLCGPDQLEDAKVSSIIRRVLTAAVELWPIGLRDACHMKVEDFEKELILPEKSAEWDDPLEAPRRPLQQDEYEQDTDEKHFTGIIMHDNDGVEQPGPPLPPRTASTLEKQAVPQGEGGTKRKPAPPLMIPPRYSTIVDDGPVDTAESPANYAAVTDGFAPARLSTSKEDEKLKKEATGGSPQIHVPKRKFLTTKQVTNAENASHEMTHSQSTFDGRVSLPGLGSVTRKPLNRSPVTASPIGNDPKIFASDSGHPPAQPNYVLTTTSPSTLPPDFRKPMWDANGRKSSYISSEGTSSGSASPRVPTPIASLARPVYPPPSGKQQPHKASTLPLPTIPKPRAASPGLLQRMPSFEQRSENTRAALAPQSPGKLTLRKKSVDDLRRLYEERVGAAQSLVEAGRHRG